MSFPDSDVAVVAGRLNREPPEYEPLDHGASIVARCWPREKTSDVPYRDLQLPRDRLLEKLDRMFKRAIADGSNTPVNEAKEEQLGDLKLYRVPWRTSVNAQQMKQVRLLDREAVAVDLLHIANLTAGEQAQRAAKRVLRTRNDPEHHLGLPLPSGSVATFISRADTRLLLEEAPLRDIAVNEDFEIAAGEAPDVQVRAVNERTVAPESIQRIPLLPGVLEVQTGMQTRVSRIEITQAGSTALSFEARLALADDWELVRSTVTPVLRDGRQVMTIEIPPGGRAMIRYQTRRRISRPMRPR
jgi:hypothetical protein